MGIPNPVTIYRKLTMKLFKRGKEKKDDGVGRKIVARKADKHGGDKVDRQFAKGMARPTTASAARLATLPPAILSRIFAFVCPHATDESYESCDLSYTEGSCMLCDLRDLAHCVQTCRAWADAGKKLM
jgi:hypothetical protein